MCDDHAGHAKEAGADLMAKLAPSKRQVAAALQGIALQGIEMTESQIRSCLLTANFFSYVPEAEEATIHHALVASRLELEDVIRYFDNGLPLEECAAAKWAEDWDDSPGDAYEDREFLATLPALRMLYALCEQIWTSPEIPPNGNELRPGRGKSTKSLHLIHAARDILEEIQPASVRAVCYQLFTLGVIPDMSKGSTSRVSVQLVYAREQGIIPWSWIVDETRSAERVSMWDHPDSFAETVQRAYRRDMWAQALQKVEVWSEKGTIRGTLAPVLDKYGVTLRVMHGYSSATVANQVASETAEMAKPLLVLYVGDWDPSGMNMSEVDLPKRVAQYGGNCHIQRVALTEDHIGDNLPSFPAESKRGDPRFVWFVEKYGETCWELDALKPTILRNEVENCIRGVIDRDEWDRLAVIERAEKESLVQVMTSWKEAATRPAGDSASGGGR
ncbi:MAG: hypothetical protein ACREV4_14950 [Gammaproteobacteria bacterium]